MKNTFRWSVIPTSLSTAAALTGLARTLPAPDPQVVKPPLAAPAPATQDDDEDAALQAAWDDQKKLHPLEGRTFTVTTLRQVWVSIHGSAPMPTLPATDTLGIVQATLGGGCSARDDDSFVLYVLRNGKLLLTEVQHDHEGHEPFIERLRQFGLQPGDTVIGWHNHNCATDCYAHAASFLAGVRLV